LVQDYPQTELFKTQIRESLRSAADVFSMVQIGENQNVYMAGDQRDMVYFIESGRIKLVMLSSEGKECTLAIHSPGDIFGELCLSGLGHRMETATAMEDSLLREIPGAKFLDRLAKDSLLEGFIKYLSVRVADQQQVISNLVTVDSEQRLGKTLLQLGRQLGRRDPRSILIELRISHEELASMVGTTRPRISVFMQRFRNLGLIELSEEHHLIIKEDKLTAYLESIA
jgi:CRP-like cAMP-binding protein